MNYTIELTQSEKDLLINTLESLLSPAMVKVQISNPHKYKSWVESTDKGREEWDNISYTLKIITSDNVWETRFGLKTRNGSEGDIELHALSIAQHFFHSIKDLSIKSSLENILWKK